MSRLITAALAFVLLSAPAAAEIYQWKDAEGKVHFTDKPPADQKTQTVNIKTPPPSPSTTETSPNASGSNDSAERQRKILKVLEDDRKAKAESQKKLDDARRAEQERCANLRDRQRLHNRGGRFYTLDAKGERVYKNDDEITKERNDIEQALKNCR